MADEKKEERGNSKEGKGDASARTKSGMKAVVLVCLGVFLAAAAGFAWMDGLFAPPPLAPVAHESDSTLDSTVLIHATSYNETPDQQSMAGAASRPSQNTLAEALQEAESPASGTDQMAGETEEWLKQEKLTLSRKQAELDQKSRELEKLKTEIEHLLTRVQETRSERIVMMAKLYDSMDPEAVARQISSMDDRTVVMLVPQMNTRTAAKVMAALDPKRAAQITTKMLALEP